MIESGCNIRTTVHRIDCYWPSDSEKMDFRRFSDIGIWLAKNEKVIDKKSEQDTVKLLADQFPFLTCVCSRDDHGRLARVQK